MDGSRGLCRRRIPEQPWRRSLYFEVPAGQAEDSTYTVEGTELGDMQRAIRTVRSRSKEWGIDPARIGVMGFWPGDERAALPARGMTRVRHPPVTPSSVSAPNLISRHSFTRRFPKTLGLLLRRRVHSLPAGGITGLKSRKVWLNFISRLPAFTYRLSSTFMRASAMALVFVRAIPAPVSGWTLSVLDWMNAQGLLKH